MSLRIKWGLRIVAFAAATMTTTSLVAVAAPPKKPAAKKVEPKKADPVKKKEEAPSLPQRESRTEAADPKETRETKETKDSKETKASAESKTTEGGNRVFRFGELEVEGRLKNPQIVYFLRRVRAEFRAGDLGHRSFMGELSETRKEPSF